MLAFRRVFNIQKMWLKERTYMFWSFMVMYVLTNLFSFIYIEFPFWGLKLHVKLNFNWTILRQILWYSWVMFTNNEYKSKNVQKKKNVFLSKDTLKQRNNVSLRGLQQCRKYMNFYVWNVCHYFLCIHINYIFNLITIIANL